MNIRVVRFISSVSDKSIKQHVSKLYIIIFCLIYTELYLKHWSYGIYVVYIKTFGLNFTGSRKFNAQLGLHFKMRSAWKCCVKASLQFNVLRVGTLEDYDWFSYDALNWKFLFKYI